MQTYYNGKWSDGVLTLTVPVDTSVLKYEANYNLQVAFKRIDQGLQFQTACNKDMLGFIISEMLGQCNENAFKITAAANYGLNLWRDLSESTTSIEVPTW